LRTFRSLNLRLPSLNAAQALEGTTSNLSPRHSKELRRRLQQNGWTEALLARSAELVHESIAIEAKMTDWRRAIRQAHMYQTGVESAAVLLPSNRAESIPEKKLARAEIGVLS